MNILLRKLIFNESDIHLILWNDKPCFFVSELSKALDSVNKEDIPVFLRNGGSAVKGIDYDVVGGAEARDLRSYLENSGIKKRFAHTMIIYFDGLRKYFNYRKTVESRDFKSYLEKCKISLEAEKVAPVGTVEAAAPKEETAPEPKEVSTQEVKLMSEVKTVSSKKKVTAPSTATTHASSPKSSGYSDFLKHISFMEEFVDSFNKLNISPDKSVAFTKSMAKFLEDNGMQAGDFLKEIKKWIV